MVNQFTGIRGLGMGDSCIFSCLFLTFSSDLLPLKPCIFGLFFWFFQALFQAFSLAFSNKKHEENWLATPIFTRAIYRLV